MAAVVRLKIAKDHLETRYARQLKGTQQSPLYLHATPLGRKKLDSIRPVELKVDLDHTDKALHKASEMMHALRDVTAVKKSNVKLNLNPKSIEGYTMELKEYLEDSELRDYLAAMRTSTVPKDTPSSYRPSSMTDERLVRISEFERKLDRARKLYETKIFSAYTTLTDASTTMDAGRIPEEEIPASEQLELLIQLQEESRKNAAFKARVSVNYIIQDSISITNIHLTAGRAKDPLGEEPC